MADIRYNRPYERLLGAEDRASQLKQLGTADLVQALAAASQMREPYMANIIATELENRLGRPGPAWSGPPSAGLISDSQAGQITDGRVFREAERLAQLGSWEYDVASDTIAWSQGLREVWGLGQDAPRALAPMLALVHEGDRAEVARVMSRAAADGMNFDITFKITHGVTGEPRRLRAFGTVARGKEGQVERVYGATQDVTGNVLREDALHHAQAQARNAERIAKVGGWEVDLRDGATKCSEGYYEICGLGPRDGPLTWDAHLLSVHPEDRQRVEEAVQATIEKGEPFLVEYRITKPRGDVAWLRGRGEPVMGDDGRVRGIVGAAQDVTQEVLAAKAVESSRRELMEFTDALTTFMARLDVEGRIVRVGKGTARAFGIPPEEFEGVSWVDGPWWAYDDAVHQRVAEKFALAAAGEVVHFAEAVKIGPNVRIVDGDLTPLFDKEGRVTSIMAEGRDVTELHELQGVLLAEQQRLARANADLEAFNYMVSHDLKGQVRGIAAYAAAISEDHGPDLPPGAQTLVEMLRRECDAMGAIIADLLMLATESGHEILRTPVDVTAAARSVASAILRREPARKVDVSVSPGLVAEADASLVRLLLQNLIGNAIKFSARKPQARIEIGQHDVAGETCFFVRDNGVGFDAGGAADVFAPFKRLHAHEGFEGTGVGLAVVRRIVQAHGGRVWAESQPGEGATFFFTLTPRAR